MLYTTDMKTRIKELRTLNGLTVIDLADKAGLSASYLSELENGRKKINSLRLEKIAEALNVSVHELIVSEDELERDILHAITILRKLNDLDRESIIRLAERLAEKSTTEAEALEDRRVTY